MTSDMKDDVEKQMNTCLDKMGNEVNESDLSLHLKDFFDKKYSPNWHCVAGKHFASYVTYTTKHYIFFYVGQLAICLYKL